MVDTVEPINLQGVITVIERDRKGNALEIALETDDFKTYVITCRKRGKELFKHIASQVNLDCRIEGKNYYGNSLITILNYTLDERGP